MRKILMAAAALSAISSPVYAGGVLGDILNTVVPGAGTVVDEAHRGFKKANPKYGKAEEQFTNNVRRELGLPEHCEPLYNKWGEEVACN